MANPEPSVFDEVDAEAEAASLRRGEADVAAGRVVGHAAVKRWLLSWGTKKKLPRPKCGE